MTADAAHLLWNEVAYIDATQACSHIRCSYFMCPCRLPYDQSKVSGLHPLACLFPFSILYTKCPPFCCHTCKLLACHNHIYIITYIDQWSTWACPCTKLHGHACAPVYIAIDTTPCICTNVLHSMCYAMRIYISTCEVP